MSREVVIPYRPRDFFRRIHFSDKRYRLAIFHRRAGKTVGFVNELIARAAQNQQESPRYAFIAPYLKQGKDIAWDYLKYYTKNIPGIKHNEAELRADFLGRRIRIYGADNPEALRGLYLDGVIFDEMDDTAMYVWKMIVRPMLVDRRGWAAFAGTPKGQANLFDLFAEAKANPDEWDAWILRARDSGIIPDDELTRIRAELTAEQYNQEFECSFEGAYVGSIYGESIHAAEIDGRITDVPYNPSYPVFTAWDLGWSDDTSIWFFQVYGGYVHCIDFYENNQKGFDHYAEIIHGKGYKYADKYENHWAAHWVPHDAKPKTLAAEGRSGAEILHSYGIRTSIVPNLSRQDGIQATRKMWPQVRMDATRCAEGLKSLRNYRRKWNQDRKTFSDEPEHNWASHAADAFRYLAIAHKELVPKRPETAADIARLPTFNELIERKKNRRNQSVF